MVALRGLSGRSVSTGLAFNRSPYRTPGNRRPGQLTVSWRRCEWSGGAEVFLIDPATGSARQLTHGGAKSPDWSPNGRRLAVVHAGWIEIMGLRRGQPRRLVRGSAPAWSPDGRELAFIGAHGRVLVISARAGRPRLVGKIRGVDVDWQPLTGGRSIPCQTAPGSMVLADSPDAVVTTRPRQSQPFATNPPASFLWLRQVRWTRAAARKPAGW